MTCCQNVSIRHHVFAFKDIVHISHPGALCPSFCLGVRPCTCPSVDVLVHFSYLWSSLYPAERITDSLTAIRKSAKEKSKQRLFIIRHRHALWCFIETSGVDSPVGIP